MNKKGQFVPRDIVSYLIRIHFCSSLKQKYRLNTQLLKHSTAAGLVRTITFADIFIDSQTNTGSLVIF